MDAGRLEEEESPFPVKHIDKLKARAAVFVIHGQAVSDTANGAISRVAI